MPVSGVFNGAASDYREMTAKVKIDRLESQGDCEKKNTTQDESSNAADAN